MYDAIIHDVLEEISMQRWQKLHDQVSFYFELNENNKNKSEIVSENLSQSVVEMELTNLIGIRLGEVQSINCNRSLVCLFFPARNIQFSLPVN